jgi:high-affinity nickel permease
MDSFLAKFGWAAKSELCDEKGMLNQQWQKYLDLDNKDALKQLGNVLFGMGFAKDTVSILAVAAIVIIGRIGLKAFCKDYGNNT